MSGYITNIFTKVYAHDRPLKKQNLWSNYACAKPDLNKTTAASCFNISLVNFFFYIITFGD